MPQTRFVLQKALELGLKPIVVINKVDKPNCQPDLVHEAVFDLMFALEANEDQLNFPTVYGSSKHGWMSDDWQNPTTDIIHLLDVIIDTIPPPKTAQGTLQLQITSIDYSSYVGRIAVGRIHRGSLRAGMPVSLVKRDGSIRKSQLKEVYLFEGLGKEKTKLDVPAGEICAVMGIEDFDIGDTIADAEFPEGLVPIKVDEPTMSMLFTINNSPFYGKDGKFVTSRHLRDRLFREIEKNLALRVEETGSPDSYLVFGRGILHLSILVETMRREGFEFQLGQPQVLIKNIDGVKCEPIEYLTVHVPEAFSGKVIDIVTGRKGELLNIQTKGDRIVLEFNIPARSIIGLRNTILTSTEGEAIIAHRYKGYEPWKGDVAVKRNGALIAMETGLAIAYAIDKLKDRGIFFAESNDPVYTGQVIGEHIRPDDLVINVCKSKKLTNMRASSADDKIVIPPPVKFSLEEAMEYIRNDEYVEVTPKSIRIRKIVLDEVERKRKKIWAAQDGPA
jgi:GTP-binding protein